MDQNQNFHYFSIKMFDIFLRKSVCLPLSLHISLFLYRREHSSPLLSSPSFYIKTSHHDDDDWLRVFSWMIFQAYPMWSKSKHSHYKFFLQEAGISRLSRYPSPSRPFFKWLLFRLGEVIALNIYDLFKLFPPPPPTKAKINLKTKKKNGVLFSSFRSIS